MQFLLTFSKRSLHDLVQVLNRRFRGDLGEIPSNMSLREDLADAMSWRCCLYECEALGRFLRQDLLRSAPGVAGNLCQGLLQFLMRNPCGDLM